MILCKVKGTVHATRKNEHLANNRILIVEPVTLAGDPQGLAMLALDVTDAGVGDLVVVNKEGGGARIIFEDEEIPLQAVVVAVVDGLETSAAGGPTP